MTAYPILRYSNASRCTRSTQYLKRFIEESMSQWKTNMTLVHKEGVLEIGPIRIKRGIFQGDSLSPLLFTMSLNPLSQELQNTRYGYQLDEQTKINHLFYVDDLKLYGTSCNQLTGLINTLKNVSDVKCAKASFKRGKKVSAEGIPLNGNQVIQDLDQAKHTSAWEWRWEKGSNTTK